MPRNRASLLPLLTAGVGLVLLPVSLFFDWYEVTVHGAQGVSEGAVSLTGWRAFEVVDAVFVLLAFGGIGVVIAEIRGGSPRGQWGLLALGGVAILVVALQLLHEPPVLGPYPLPESSPTVGAWLGLAAAILVFSAGILSLGATKATRSED